MTRASQRQKFNPVALHANPLGANPALRPFLVIHDQHAAILQLHRRRIRPDHIVDREWPGPRFPIIAAHVNRRLRVAVAQDDLPAAQPREMRCSLQSLIGNASLYPDTT